MDKTLGIIYYTDNKIDHTSIIPLARKTILASGLPIVSTSLKSIDFGENYFIEGRFRSYPTMVDQIVLALEKNAAKYVFFCEHDVLYHKSHFDFIPSQDDVFYYNSNVWRWRFGGDIAIRYDGMLPLSCMCANRDFALAHYQMRQEKIKEWGLDELRSREPRKARIWGYEPGRKKMRNGGFSNDKSDVWHSEFPNIDIRHGRTFSRLKCTKDDFIRPPENWQEIPSNQIPGWNLKELFGL